jgi:heme A synthase
MPYTAPPGFGLLGAEEVPMNWNKWIRRSHRWLSIAFTLVVIVNGIAVARGRYTNRLGLMAVATLALQFFTGMYLFVLPYAARWRGGRLTD